MTSAIGGLLKIAREKKKLSQTQAAKLFKFSEQFLGRIEAGEAPLPLNHAKKVQKTFKLRKVDVINAYLEDYVKKVEKVLNGKTKAR